MTNEGMTNAEYAEKQFNELTGLKLTVALRKLRETNSASKIVQLLDVTELFSNSEVDNIMRYFNSLNGKVMP